MLKECGRRAGARGKVTILYRAALLEIGVPVTFISCGDPSHFKDSHGTLNKKQNESYKLASVSTLAVLC